MLETREARKGPPSAMVEEAFPSSAHFLIAEIAASVTKVQDLRNRLTRKNIQLLGYTNAEAAEENSLPEVRSDALFPRLVQELQALSVELSLLEKTVSTTLTV